ncbi:MAG: hypothetical protein OR994_05795, partial [Candidatus Poseidoniales archaeon]|nr:hypothetical protein [Candidatus Poseidoniales archaeon]
QTPKHAQTDSVTTINTLAGGRANVEDGLQTGLDIVATLAWWDWNIEDDKETAEDVEAQSDTVITTGTVVASLASLICTVAAVYFATKHPKEKETE